MDDFIYFTNRLNFDTVLVGPASFRIEDALGAKAAEWFGSLGFKYLQASVVSLKDTGPEIIVVTNNAAGMEKYSDETLPEVVSQDDSPLFNKGTSRHLHSVASMVRGK